jgi:TolB-like protein
MRLDRLFEELRRRRVLRVIGAYAVAAWVAVEVYTTIQPILWPAHEWTNRLVVVLVLAGFPAVFALAWIFDITPQGLRRTRSLESGVTAGQRMLTPRATGFFGLGVLVAIVSLAAYAGLHRTRSADPARSAAAIQSIAVLPFADMSPARDQEYFGDGIAEELLNRLAQVPELRVPARTSSFAFKGRNADVREIGRRLNVQAVLEGSVRRDGDRLRVTAQLIDVATGYHLWSDTFERDASRIFALQDEIANRVVDVVRLRFVATPEAGERGTSNQAALAIYYRGMERWNERTVASLQQALRDFREAIRADSAFALAHAALAQTYAVLPAYGAYPPDSAFTNGMAAAARALRLDPSIAAAYAAMGQLVQNIEWDPRAAEEYYRRALGYNPGYATAHVWYAEALILLQEFDDAAEHVAAALAIDPLSPVSLHVDAILKTMRGDVEEGLAAWRNLTRTNPTFPVAFLHHAYAALAAGRTDEAIRSIGRLAQMRASHAQLYQAIGAALRDRSAIPGAVAAVEAASLSSSERAAWATILGAYDVALVTLERAVRAQDDVSIPFLLLHPLLAPLRDDPRFPRIH